MTRLHRPGVAGQIHIVVDDCPRFILPFSFAQIDGTIRVMDTQILTQLTVTHQQVIDLVKTLPVDRMRTLYDFVLFLKLQPLTPIEEEDIFGESPDEIRADEERWNEQFANTREKLRALALEAAAEFQSGQTKPMEFTPEGRLAR
jgi:hypothetical protein